MKPKKPIKDKEEYIEMIKAESYLKGLIDGMKLITLAQDLDKLKGKKKNDKK